MSSEAPGSRPAWAQELHRVTHDLRSPLASIAGYADLLHRRIYGDLNESQAKAIEAIHRRVADLRRRMDGFADWLYLCTDEPLPPPAPTDIAPLVEGEAERIGMEIITEGDGRANAVAGPLGVAVRELLLNAQAVSDAPVRVRIRPEAESLVIEIEDDGPGPPDELFEGRTKPEGGARRAAGWLARMDGRLTFTARAPRGTIARVTLPHALDLP